MLPSTQQRASCAWQGGQNSLGHPAAPRSVPRTVPQQRSESGRCRGLSPPQGSPVPTLSFHSNQMFARGSAERKPFKSSQSAYRASRLPGRCVASRQRNGAVRGDSHPLLQRGPARTGAGELTFPGRTFLVTPGLQGQPCCV